MAQPSTAIQRSDLSATFSEFDLEMNKKGFIGAAVLRPISVGLQSDNIGKIPLEQLLQTRNTKRAPGGGYKRGTFDFDTFSYATEENGWEEVVDDRQLALYRNIIDAESVHAARAMHIVQQTFEHEAAALLYDTATWTGASLTLAVTTPWSTWATATPVANVLFAKEKVQLNSGLEANTLICNRAQYDDLINTDEIKDRLVYVEKATQANLRRAVAEILGLEKILVAGGSKNTAKLGQTASMARVWSNSYAMVCRTAETDDPQEPCVARGFMWDGDGPGAAGTEDAVAVTVEEYREENRRGGVMRARTDHDQVVMYAEAGFLLSNVKA